MFSQSTHLRNSVLRKSLSLFIALTFLASNIAFAAPQDKPVAPDKPAQSFTNPDQIVIPREYGLIKSRFTGKDDRLIIHIQDAHCNYEAQANIAKILENLIKNYNLNLVSVEGADGYIDTSWFKAFPDDEVRKEVAGYFMRKGEITGPEFLSITTDYNFKLYGAETRSYYIQNLNAFTSSYPLKDQTEKYFNQIKTILNRLKGYIYTEELKTMDARMADYETKKLQFNEYVRFLQSEAERQKINLRDYDNFFKLVSVLIYEKKIDFNVTDKERNVLIDELSKVITKEALTDMVGRSLSFKSGKISSAEYYNYLKGLAIKSGIDLAKKYPNLYNYIIYNSVYSKIENEKLFKDIENLENAVKEKMFKNDDQRALDRLSRHIDILLGLVNIKLLNGDYDYFEKHKDEFSYDVFSSFIQKKAIQYGLAYDVEPPSETIANSIPKLEDFYSIAIKRDKALVDNTLAAMKKDKKDIAVLVTGGFHSEGVTKLLKDGGVSYIVVCPSITKDVPSPYIQILTNQKTSFEDILAGTGSASEAGQAASGKGQGMVAPYSISAACQLSKRDLRDIDRLIGEVNDRGLIDRVEAFETDWAVTHITRWIGKAEAFAGRKSLPANEELLLQAYLIAVKDAVRTRKIPEENERIVAALARYAFQNIFEARQREIAASAFRDIFKAGQREPALSAAGAARYSSTGLAAGLTPSEIERIEGLITEKEGIGKNREGGYWEVTASESKDHQELVREVSAIVSRQGVPAEYAGIASELQNGRIVIRALDLGERVGFGRDNPIDTDIYCYSKVGPDNVLYIYTTQVFAFLANPYYNVNILKAEAGPRLIEHGRAVFAQGLAREYALARLDKTPPQAEGEEMLFASAIARERSLPDIRLFTLDQAALAGNATYLLNQLKVYDQKSDRVVKGHRPYAEALINALSKEFTLYLIENDVNAVAADIALLPAVVSADTNVIDRATLETRRFREGVAAALAKSRESIKESIYRSLTRKEVDKDQDLRAEATECFTAEVVYRVARSYGMKLRELNPNGKDLARERLVIVLGKDPRPSNIRMRDTSIRALNETGIDVVDIAPAEQVTSTPMVGYAIESCRGLAEMLGGRPIDGGIQLSASHLEWTYGGMKFYTGRSNINEGALKAVLDMAEKGVPYVRPAKEPEAPAGLFVYEKLISDYTKHIYDYMYSRLGEKGRSAIRKRSIVIDVANGTSAPFVEALRQVGANVIGMYVRPNGYFPNKMPNPQSSWFDTTSDLIGMVGTVGADLGTIFDADADRVGFVTKKAGRVTRVTGHELMIYLADRILDVKHGGTVVFNNRCTMGMEEVIRRKGGEAVRGPTGYSRVIATIESEQARGKNVVLGGEESAHIMLPENNFRDDGIFSAATLITMMAGDKKSFGETLSTEFPYYNLEKPIRVRIVSEDATVCKETKRRIEAEALRRVREMGIPEGRIYAEDGTWVYLDHLNGWLLMRGALGEMQDFTLNMESRRKEEGLALAQLGRDILEPFVASGEVDTTNLDNFIKERASAQGASAPSLAKDRGEKRASTSGFDAVEHKDVETILGEISRRRTQDASKEVRREIAKFIRDRAPPIYGIRWSYLLETGKIRIASVDMGDTTSFLHYKNVIAFPGMLQQIIDARLIEPVEAPKSTGNPTQDKKNLEKEFDKTKKRIFRTIYVPSEALEGEENLNITKEAILFTLLQEWGRYEPGITSAEEARRMVDMLLVEGRPEKPAAFQIRGQLGSKGFYDLLTVLNHYDPRIDQAGFLLSAIYEAIDNELDTMMGREGMPINERGRNILRLTTPEQLYAWYTYSFDTSIRPFQGVQPYDKAKLVSRKLDALIEAEVATRELVEECFFKIPYDSPGCNTLGEIISNPENEIWFPETTVKPKPENFKRGEYYIAQSGEAKRLEKEIKKREIKLEKRHEGMMLYDCIEKFRLQDVGEVRRAKLAEGVFAGTEGSEGTEAYKQAWRAVEEASEARTEDKYASKRKEAVRLWEKAKKTVEYKAYQEALKLALATEEVQSVEKELKELGDVESNYYAILHKPFTDFIIEQVKQKNKEKEELGDTRPIVIAIEGTGGAGKSTLVGNLTKAVFNYLKSENPAFSDTQVRRLIGLIPVDTIGLQPGGVRYEEVAGGERLTISGPLDMYSPQTIAGAIQTLVEGGRLRALESDRGGVIKTGDVMGPGVRVIIVEGCTPLYYEEVRQKVDLAIVVAEETDKYRIEGKIERDTIPRYLGGVRGLPRHHVINDAVRKWREERDFICRVDLEEVADIVWSYSRDSVQKSQPNYVHVRTKSSPLSKRPIGHAVPLTVKAGTEIGGVRFSATGEGVVHAMKEGLAQVVSGENAGLDVFTAEVRGLAVALYEGSIQVPEAVEVIRRVSSQYPIFARGWLAEGLKALTNDQRNVLEPVVTEFIRESKDKITRGDNVVTVIPLAARGGRFAPFAWYEAKHFYKLFGTEYFVYSVQRALQRDNNVNNIYIFVQANLEEQAKQALSSNDIVLPPQNYIIMHEGIVQEGGLELQFTPEKLPVFALASLEIIKKRHGEDTTIIFERPDLVLVGERPEETQAVTKELNDAMKNVAAVASVEPTVGILGNPPLSEERKAIVEGGKMPPTGKGYIFPFSTEEINPIFPDTKTVRLFHEKPEDYEKENIGETARRYLQPGLGGTYNASYFIFRARTMLQLMEVLRPDEYRKLMKLEQPAGKEPPSHIITEVYDFFVQPGHDASFEKAVVDVLAPAREGAPSYPQFGLVVSPFGQNVAKWWVGSQGTHAAVWEQEKVEGGNYVRPKAASGRNVHLGSDVGRCVVLLPEDDVRTQVHVAGAKGLVISYEGRKKALVVEPMKNAKDVLDVTLAVLRNPATKDFAVLGAPVPVAARTTPETKTDQNGNITIFGNNGFGYILNSVSTTVYSEEGIVGVTGLKDTIVIKKVTEGVEHIYVYGPDALSEGMVYLASLSPYAESAAERKRKIENLVRGYQKTAEAYEGGTIPVSTFLLERRKFIQETKPLAEEAEAEFEKCYETYLGYLRDDVDTLVMLAVIPESPKLLRHLDTLKSERYKAKHTEEIARALYKPWKAVETFLWDYHTVREMVARDMVSVQTIQYARAQQASPIWKAMDERLRDYGIITEEDLVSVHSMLAESRQLDRKTLSKVTTVIVISKIKVGSEIAINGVALAKIEKTFPNAKRIILLGSPHGQKIFGGNPKISYTPEARKEKYAAERQLYTNQTAELIAEATQGLKEDEFVVFEPGISRITQFGMMPPLAPALAKKRYFFWNEVVPEESTISTTVNEWINGILGEEEEVLPRVFLPQDRVTKVDALFAKTGFDKAGKPVVVFTIEVSGDEKKDIGIPFDRLLVQTLVEKGYNVIIRKGYDPYDEAYRVEEVVHGLSEDIWREVNVEDIDTMTPLEGKYPVIAIGDTRIKRNAEEGPEDEGFLAALIKRADIWVGYSSSPKHMAGAQGKAGVVLYLRKGSDNLAIREEGRFASPKDSWLPPSTVVNLCITPESKKEALESPVKLEALVSRVITVTESLIKGEQPELPVMLSLAPEESRRIVNAVVTEVEGKINASPETYSTEEAKTKLLERATKDITEKEKTAGVSMTAAVSQAIAREAKMRLRRGSTSGEGRESTAGILQYEKERIEERNISSMRGSASGLAKALAESGKPVYLQASKTGKPWGRRVAGEIQLIGEYEYSGQGSRIAMPGIEGSIGLVEAIAQNPEAILGASVVDTYGTKPILVKYLTPGQTPGISDLSRQLHNTKNEIWIVARTTVENPQIILGFNPRRIAELRTKEEFVRAYEGALVRYVEALENLNRALLRHPRLGTALQEGLGNVGNTEVYVAQLLRSEIKVGKNVQDAYTSLISAKEELNSFYNFVNVNAGQVISIPVGTVHALLRGVEVIEPQIEGETLPLEDQARYPIRYNVVVENGMMKAMETRDKTYPAKEIFNAMNLEYAPSEPLRLEGFEKGVSGEVLGEFPGLSVHRVVLERGAKHVDTTAKGYHILIASQGKAVVKTQAGEASLEAVEEGRIPAAIIVPASVGEYEIISEEGVQIIKSFAPMPEGEKVARLSTSGLAKALAESGRPIAFVEPNIRTGQHAFTWGELAKYSKILKFLGITPAQLGLNENEPVSEYWIASDDEKYPSQIDLGKGERISLREFLAAHAVEVLGGEHVEAYGPYLGCVMKLLDARDTLSIAVHPVEGHEKLPPKPEYWKMLGEGATVYFGFNRDVTPEEIEAAVPKPSQEAEAILKKLQAEDKRLEKMVITNLQRLQENEVQTRLAEAGLSREEQELLVAFLRRNGALEDLLNIERYNEGDLVDIPGATIHAIRGRARDAVDTATGRSESSFIAEWSQAPAKIEAEKGVDLGKAAVAIYDRDKNLTPPKTARPNKENPAATIAVMKDAVDRGILPGAFAKLEPKDYKLKPAPIYRDAYENEAFRLFESPVVIVEEMRIAEGAQKGLVVNDIKGRGYPVFVEEGAVEIKGTNPKGETVSIQLAKGEGAIIPAAISKSVAVASVAGKAVMQRWFAPLPEEKETIKADEGKTRVAVTTTKYSKTISSRASSSGTTKEEPKKDLVEEIRAGDERDINELRRTLSLISMNEALLTKGVVIVNYDTGLAREETGQVARGGEAGINRYLNGALINIRGTGRQLLEAAQAEIARLKGAGKPIAAVVTIAGDATVKEAGAELMGLGKVITVQNPDNRHIPLPGLYDLALRIAYDMGEEYILECLNRIALNPDNRPFTRDDVENLLVKGIIAILPKIGPVDTSDEVKLYKAAQLALTMV